MKTLGLQVPKIHSELSVKDTWRNGVGILYHTHDTDMCETYIECS